MHSIRTSRTFLVLMATAIGIFILSGCDSGLFDPPRAPVISGMDAGAYQVDPGDTVSIMVTVEEEESVITYQWSAEQGQLIPPLDNAEVLWKAPAVGGSYNITVKVSNEDKSAEKTVTIIVRSYTKPLAQITSPQAGTYHVQHTTLQITANANHENGIREVSLYIADQYRDRKAGNSSGEYSFEQVLDIPAGETEIKIQAIANTTGTVASDSINIFVEGIVAGKR